ncbi:MAG: hypothetical protein GF346_00160 [Candidatus Eisenbacteria bacterium]|nr:hypothetical protein [Candidatus Latescibacterota bacterium]MBD3300845.1 hypothetical protein [Candidatus Eisenbacteria bacterium]
MSARHDPSGALFLRGIQLTIAGTVLFASLWGLLGGLGGCRDQTTAPIDRNQPPETFITSAPGDSQTAFYRIALHWSGTDHDGEVVGFEVAVTESLPDNEEEIEWSYTRRSDSLLTFPVEERQEVLGHRFYVRAIDDDGRTDETPAFIFFGARNNSPPRVEFLRAQGFGPNGETMEITSDDPFFPTDTIPTGWGVRFSWTGFDDDVMLDPLGNVVHVGRVASFSHRLLPVESEFLGRTLADTAQTYGPEFFNRFPQGDRYAFDVRAIDDGGLSGSGTVTRSFVWNRDPISRITRCLAPNGIDSLTCFVSGDTSYFSGDTLPLPTGNEDFPFVEFSATATDPDPVDGDPSIADLEWRRVTGAIISPWNSLAGGETARLDRLVTGNYIAMVRATDRLGRTEGTPDSVVFYVNFAPRFITSTESFQQTPLPGDTYSRSELEAEGLTTRFLVENKDAFYSERVRYGVRLDTPFGRDVRAHHRRSLPDGFVYESTVRADTSWTPGSYVLHVVAEDNRQQGGQSRGIRSATRSVPFTVTAE